MSKLEKQRFQKQMKEFYISEIGKKIRGEINFFFSVE